MRSCQAPLFLYFVEDSTPLPPPPPPPPTTTKQKGGGAHYAHKNTYAQLSFMLKLQSWGLHLYQKRESGHMDFQMNFVKFLRTLPLQNIFGQLFSTIFPWNTKFRFSFFQNFLMIIYWSFNSLGLCFCLI